MKAPIFLQIWDEYGPLPIYKSSDITEEVHIIARVHNKITASHTRKFSYLTAYMSGGVSLLQF